MFPSVGGCIPRPARPAAAILLALLVLACGGGDAGSGTAGDADGDQDHVEKMAREHEGDQPVPSPATEESTEGVAFEREVVYATVDGEQSKGFLVLPEGGATGAPAMIVIHEWWGLNENIQTMARKLAAEGYVALAVDLYGGEVATDSEGARGLMMQSMARRGALEENLRQAYAFLEAQGTSRVGSIGWCFGGGWSLNTALLLPEQLAAAVIYYGRVKTEPAELETLTAPVLGIFGAEDQGIPVDSVRAFEKALNELGKEAEIHVYEGADHAFANPSGLRYQAEAAEDAWAKTLSFLAARLGAS